MPDSLRHVSIHCGPPAEAGLGIATDLSLPAAMTVGELLPWIVDALDIGDGTPRRWQLAQLSGRCLDESATLVQNDIRDGDLLILAGVDDQPKPVRPTIAALTSAPPTEGFPAGQRVAGCLWACALGIVVLPWAGLGSNGLGRVAAAAVMTIVVTVIAAAATRLRLDSAVIAALDVVAVAHAGVLGFLVVPAGPAPANFFLGAVAAGSLGSLLIRTSGRGTQILLAVVTTAALVAVTTGCAALWQLPTTELGAVLAALGVGMLALTPRLSIALAGLTPPMPDDPDTEAAALGDNAFDTETRALAGHRNLVGLVLGCSIAAALGTAILATAGMRRVSTPEVAFAAAVGLALVLRTRTYASGHCRTALIISGFCSLTAAFVLVVAWAPEYASWAGVFAVATGIAVLWPITLGNPRAGRVADALEYAALAAVAPLACWLSGAFELVRGLGLQ